MTPRPLSCESAIDRLQRRLDGELADWPAEILEHLDHCADCAERFAIGEKVVALFPPRLPTDFAVGVVRAIQAERRSRRTRYLLLAGVAIAAAMLLAVSLRVSPPVRQPEVARSIPRLDTAMTDATTVVRQWAGRVALPELPEMPGVDVATALDPATNAISDAGRSLAVSVEPLADSARRAMGRFWNDLPIN